MNCIQQRWAVGDDMNTTLTYEEKKKKKRARLNQDKTENTLTRK